MSCGRSAGSTLASVRIRLYFTLTLSQFAESSLKFKNSNSRMKVGHTDLIVVLQPANFASGYDLLLIFSTRFLQLCIPVRYDRPALAKDRERPTHEPVNAWQRTELTVAEKIHRTHQVSVRRRVAGCTTCQAWTRASTRVLA